MSSIKTLIAEMTIENAPIPVKIELYPEIAPITVQNFVDLCKSGFYNGLTFHRIIPGFMAQGGCPKGNGTGGPGHTIKGEFAANGVKNDLSHTRGVISMARSQSFNSAGSQFFIMFDDNTFLDRQYAAFGKVISGMETVDDFLKLKYIGEHPLNPPVIKSICIIEE